MRSIRVLLLFVLAPAAALAQGPPAIGFSVLGGGGGTASGGAITLADSLGEPITGASSGGSASLSGGFFPGALLDGDETWCALPAGLTGAHDFHLSAKVGISVATTGTLGCLRLKRTDGLPPNWESGLQSDRWWEATGTDAGGATASGFSLSMTLPYTGPLADPRVCRWAGTQWDCVASSSTAATVTRDAITLLSEWAVGNGPVPVTLTRFQID